MIDVNLVADSVNIYGDRLTTFELTVPKFILAEINKHRVLSNNAQSTRAVPLHTQIRLVEENPFVPTVWGKKQSGMFAQATVDDPVACEYLWRKACEQAIQHAKWMDDLGLHKQTAGRLLEPFSWCKVVISGTSWSNFLHLRMAENAQPEIREVAGQIKNLLVTCVPVLCEPFSWHTPYVDKPGEQLELPEHVSAARCARVSYGRVLTFNVEQEMDRYTKLVGDKHWSALEHPAMCLEESVAVKHFTGWKMLRAFYPNEHDASL